jgi:hypothetical protein
MTISQHLMTGPVSNFGLILVPREPARQFRLRLIHSFFC